MKKILYPALLLASIYGCIAIKPTERIEFTAHDLYPEGIAWDQSANVYYVSSARTGAVGKVTPAGEYSELHRDTTLKSTYGMKLHPDGKKLYVCASDANYSRNTSPDTRNKLARLIQIDVASGKKVADIDLAPLYKGEHFINDLTFDDKGNAYITDSYSNVIYKLDANN